MIVLILLFLLAAVGRAEAQGQTCDPAAFALPYVEAFLAGEPLSAEPPPAGEAACQQQAAVARLAETLGPVVGYKAAATSAAMRERLGLSAPVMGVLLERMMLPGGATVAIDDGARMVVELDLLARIGPEGVLGITDDVSALAAIDAFIPFVELGDLMLAEGTPMTGPLLEAMNAGARLGVVGEPQPRGDMTPEDVEVLFARLTQGGATLAEGELRSIGAPLDALLFVVAEAEARGIALKPGDLISLGAMAPAIPATPGALSATYEGFGLDPITLSLTLK